MCALGLGWSWLWECLVWVLQRSPQPSQRGTPREDPPKARKAGIKLKPKGSMDPWGNVNLPGTAWPWRSFPTAMILWVNSLCPPFYHLRVSCQDFFLVGPAAPGKGSFLPHFLCTLSIIQSTWISWNRKQLLLWQSDFCAASERQVPLTEKWQSLGVIWDSGSNSKQNVCAACSQISQIQGAGRWISTLLMMQDVAVKVDHTWLGGYWYWGHVW